MRSLRQWVCVVALVLCLFPLQTVSQNQSSSQADAGANSTSTTKTKSDQDKDKVTCSDSGTYVNSKGKTVRRPENCSGPPKGATAQCRDGSYSFSRSRRGTCSHHGGVAKWL